MVLPVTCHQGVITAPMQRKGPEQSGQGLDAGRRATWGRRRDSGRRRKGQGVPSGGMGLATKTLAHACPGTACGTAHNVPSPLMPFGGARGAQAWKKRGWVCARKAHASPALPLHASGRGSRCWQCWLDPCAGTSPWQRCHSIAASTEFALALCHPSGRSSLEAFPTLPRCLDPLVPRAFILHAAKEAGVGRRSCAEMVSSRQLAVPGQSGQVGCRQPATFSILVRPGQGPGQARGEGCRNLITGVEGGDAGLAPGCPRRAVVAAGISGPAAAEGC